MDERRRCTATAKSTRQRCRRAAVPGGTVCVKHGGGSPRARAAAARRVEHAAAERLVVAYGLPADVQPSQALEDELARTAGHVRWLGALIAGLELDELVQTSAAGVEIPAVWLELYQHERQHLARVARDSLSAGVEERRVKLDEETGRQIATAIRAIVAALGHDPMAPEVRAIVRRELTAVRTENGAGHHD
jgi:hypothetical protein